jgi:hypothetical protein
LWRIIVPIDTIGMVDRMTGPSVRAVAANAAIAMPSTRRCNESRT